MLMEVEKDRNEEKSNLLSLVAIFCRPPENENVTRSAKRKLLVIRDADDAAHGCEHLHMDDRINCIASTTMTLRLSKMRFI